LDAECLKEKQTDRNLFGTVMALGRGSGQEWKHSSNEGLGWEREENGKLISGLAPFRNGLDRVKEITSYYRVKGKDGGNSAGEYTTGKERS